MLVKELIESFERNPQRVVNSLIKKNKLKGDIRAHLGVHILQNSENPKWTDYLWIPLSPSTLSLTTVKNFCNLNCRMCNPGKGTLEYLTADQVDTMLIHAPTTELVIFVAGDSEPLLNPEFPEILQVIKKHGISSNIISNGHLLTEEKAAMMIEIGQPNYLDISLDSVDPQIYQNIRGGKIDRVLKGLRRLCDMRNTANANAPHVSLLMVGMEDNIVGLNDFIDFAAEIGAVRVHIDHLLGDSKPGDFTKHPNWKAIIKSALKHAEKKGILLQVPIDSLNQLQEKNVFEPEKNPKLSVKTCDSPKKNMDSVSAVSKNIQFSQPMKFSMCPWMNSIHVDFDGGIRPCCFMPANMGNIYEQPLKDNFKFLQIKTAYLSGKIQKGCMGGKNCHFVQEIIQRKIKPDFIDDELVATNEDIIPKTIPKDLEYVAI